MVLFILLGLGLGAKSIMKSDGNSTFMRITNKDIYEAIKKNQEKNAKEHAELKQHLIVTNGKVKLNTYRSSLAIGGIVGLAGWMFFLLSKF